jgi:hypothetical protein
VTAKVISQPISEYINEKVPQHLFLETSKNFKLREKLVNRIFDPLAFHNLKVCATYPNLSKIILVYITVLHFTVKTEGIYTGTVR